MSVDLDTAMADRPVLPAGGTLVRGRMGSIDAYRGLVMFLMMAEVLRCCEVASALPGNVFWELLCHHQSHVEWTGCVLHDLIQPSFSFLVGVALPFSIASRLRRGQTPGWMTAHALWRSLVLVFLGVFLRSIGHRQTNFTFEDTLSQIGLGYTFLFLLGLRSVRASGSPSGPSWWATGRSSRPIRFARILIIRRFRFPRTGRT